MKVYVVLIHHYPERVFETFEKAKESMYPQIKKFLDKVLEDDVEGINYELENFEKNGIVDDYCYIKEMEVEG